MPYLSEPKIIMDISQFPRYSCNFEDFKKEEKSFASKQKYVQLLKILHDQNLPDQDQEIQIEERLVIETENFPKKETFDIKSINMIQC